jgi:hypothetical protein
MWSPGGLTRVTLHYPRRNKRDGKKLMENTIDSQERTERMNIGNTNLEM